MTTAHLEVTTNQSGARFCRRDRADIRTQRPIRRSLLLLRAPAPIPDGPSSADMSALLTVNEACARLRISRWMLYRLIQQRELRTIAIGRRRLVPSAAIESFVERRQHLEDE